MVRRRVTLSRLVLLFSAVLLGLFVQASSCGGGGGDGVAGPPPPTTDFLVSFSEPANAETNVPLNPIIYVRFNRAVNFATISSSSFWLSDPSDMTIAAAYVNYPCPPTSLNEVWLIPSGALTPGLTYTVRLSTAVRDTNGVALTQHTFTFTTGSGPDATRPSSPTNVMAAPPDAMTSISANELELNWTASMDEVPTSLVYDIYMSQISGCFDFPAGPNFSTAAGMTTFTVQMLAPNTTYFFVIRARDTSGNIDAITDPSAAQVQGTTRVSFNVNVWGGIVSPICSACHTSGAGSAVMVMNSAPATYGAWVNVTSSCTTAAANGFPLRVDPGSAATSFVYNKVSQAIPACGLQMPEGGPFLSAGQLAIIENWINQGALDN